MSGRKTNRKLGSTDRVQRSRRPESARSRAHSGPRHRGPLLLRLAWGVGQARHMRTHCGTPPTDKAMLACDTHDGKRTTTHVQTMQMVTGCGRGISGMAKNHVKTNIIGWHCAVEWFWTDIAPNRSQLNAIANYLTSEFAKKVKNKIHCNKYNTGVHLKSSSKTTLSAEHERVFLNPILHLQLQKQWSQQFLKTTVQRRPCA